MGLRSPAELSLQGPQVSALPTARFQELKREEMSKAHIETASRGLSSIQSAQEKMLADQERRLRATAIARMKAEGNKLRINEQGKVTSTQGWGALEISGKSSSNLDKELRKLTETFDPKYREDLEIAKLEIQNQYTRSVQPYVVGEVKKATKATFDAVIADTMNDAVLSSGDPQEFDMLLGRVGQEVRTRASVQYGWDEEAEVMPGMKLGELIKNEEDAAKSRTVRNAVGMLVNGEGVNSVMLAENLFERHLDTMNAEDQQAARKMLEKGREKEDDLLAAYIADDLVTRFPLDPVAADKAAMAEARSGSQYNKIKKNYEDKIQDRRDAEKYQTEQQVKSIYEAYDNGTPDRELLKMVDNLPDPDERIKLREQYNKNGKSFVPNVTDDQVYASASERILFDFEGIEREEKLGGSFLAKQRPFVSPSDYNTLKSMYENKKKAASDQVAARANNFDKMAREVGTSVNNELGITSKKGGLENIEKTKRLAIEVGRDFLISNPRATDEEFRTAVRRSLFQQINKPQVKERSSFGKAWQWVWSGGEDNFDTNYYLESPSSKRPTVPAEELSNSKRLTPEKLNEVRQGIIEGLKKRGVTPSEEEIQTRIQKLINENKI